MSIVCTSACVHYVADNPQDCQHTTFSASVSAYTCTGVPDCGGGSVISPPAFPVAVTSATLSSGAKQYTISLGPLGGTNNIIYTYNIPSDSSELINNNQGVALSYGPNGSEGTQSCGTPNAAITQIVLGGDNNSLSTGTEANFVTGDTYIINVRSCCNGSAHSIQVTFTRPLWFAQDVAGPTCVISTPGNVCPTDCGNVKIPAITIYGQTSVTGMDIGDMIFTIYDKFKYYKEEPLNPELKCVVEYEKSPKVKTTTFHKCCPRIVSVLRGKGVTAYCKVESIWLSTQPNVFLFNFYQNIIQYAMLKYILARLLYGEFNINFLLGKYNEKFLNDLAQSRFCAFVTNFEDCNSPIFGYNKYFKSGKKCTNLI